jgi:hypothetical protein
MEDIDAVGMLLWLVFLKKNLYQAINAKKAEIIL